MCFVEFDDGAGENENDGASVSFVAFDEGTGDIDGADDSDGASEPCIEFDVEFDDGAGEKENDGASVLYVAFEDGTDDGTAEIDGASDDDTSVSS